MGFAVTDLFCGSCGAYAHAFLDACPFCGAPRRSGLADALADPAAGGALARDTELRATADAVAKTTAIRSSLRSGIGGALGEAPDVAHAAELDVAELVDVLTGSMRYRAWPGEAAPVADVRLRLDAGRLVLSKERTSVADVALALVIGIGCASDRGAGSSGARPALVQPAERRQGQQVAVAAATPDGIERVAFGNPAGFFATKARPDHFATLAWWLGVAAAVASARRWEEIGAAQHAAELGIRAASAG